MISRHLLELRLLARCRFLTDHPGAAEIGAVALIGDADIGPQHVAGDQFALSCQQRQRQIAVGGPNAVRLVFAASPARSAPACWPSRPARKSRRMNLADRSICRIPGASAACTSTMAVSVIRTAVRMQANSSGVLMSLAAPTICAASAGRPDRNSRGCARRIAPVSSSTATTAAAGSRSSITRAKFSTPSSNSRYTGPCRWSVGQTRFRRGAFTERQEQMRVRIVGEHHRDRSLDIRQPGVTQRPAHPGGVHDAVVAQQNQGVHAAIGHRRPQPRAGLATHPLEVRCLRNVERRRGCGQKRSGLTSSNRPTTPRIR